MLKKERILALANERIEELNKQLFIVDLTISRSNQITLELDVENGNVSIEDCISVSRNIEHNLDREQEDFELMVTSAGLDKPFRVLKQYIKNIGQEVNVLLKEKHQSVKGTLRAADEDGIIIETVGKERVEGRKKKEIVTRQHSFTYEEIKETKIIISFKK